MFDIEYFCWYRYKLVYKQTNVCSHILVLHSVQPLSNHSWIIPVLNVWDRICLNSLEQIRTPMTDFRKSLRHSTQFSKYWKEVQRKDWRRRQRVYSTTDHVIHEIDSIRIILDRDRKIENFFQ